jgi:hypothetical protein
MENALPAVLALIVVVLIAAVPLTILDKIRDARGRKLLMRQAEFARDNHAEYGEQMRLETGTVSPDELAAFWVELTDFIAVTDGLVNRGLVVQMLAQARRNVATNAAAADQPPAE